MSTALLDVGIVGATGAVGKEIIGCLVGSKRSAGHEIQTNPTDS